MDFGTKILLIGIGWALLNLLVARFTLRSRGGTVGLPIAYMFATSFMYLGALVYAVPGYSHIRPDGDLYLAGYEFDESTVLLGFSTSLLGMAGFALACYLFRGRSMKRSAVKNTTFDRDANKKVLVLFGTLAIFGYILGFIDITFPLKDVIRQVCQNCGIVLVCLGAYFATIRRDSLTPWIVLAAFLTLSSLIFAGFVSYGFITLMICTGFWMAVLMRRKPTMFKMIGGAAGATYALICIFVGWMTFRVDLRETLWDQNAGLVERLSAIYSSARQIQLFLPSNFTSLDLVNTRLNQNIFVGKVIEWHALHPDLRMYGENMYMLFLAWIPRVIWQGKPEQGGSDFLSTHAGLELSDTSTFGAGPVIEWFVNFGYLGVFVGCFALGAILRFIDLKAARAIRRGEYLYFGRWFLVGIALIAPLTDMFFLSNSAIASYALISAVNLVFKLDKTHGYRQIANRT